MKWFKHMSDASDDEFIALLEDEMGLVGYAIFWKCCEVVAAKMDDSDRCHATYSWSMWRKKLRTNKPKLNRFLTIVEDNCKFDVTITENKLKIAIPKLLELRDNYSKNLQATSKSLASKEVEVEVEVEVDKERPKPKKKKMVDKYNGDIGLIISDLNAVCGTNYRSTTETTVKRITKLLEAGFTVDNFKRVHRTKFEQWGGDPANEQYLRPETLYSSKFEGYLNKRTFDEMSQSPF